MAAKDKGDISFTCRSCGREGWASTSMEDSGYGSPNFQFLSVSEGFKVSKRSEFPTTARIRCIKCKRDVADGFGALPS